jgi:5-methylcytosine-specific restriction endonuclease McrBC regulatory subunit McrC
MDKLFQDFVGKFLREKLEQKREYTEISKKKGRLYVHIDIQLFHNNSPIMILDTKYKEYSGENPSEDDIAQMAYYSNTTGIKQCVLVYPGIHQPKSYNLKGNIILHIMFIDLFALDIKEFEKKCLIFVNHISGMINSLKD